LLIVTIDGGVVRACIGVI